MFLSCVVTLCAVSMCGERSCGWVDRAGSGIPRDSGVMLMADRLHGGWHAGSDTALYAACIVQQASSATLHTAQCRKTESGEQDESGEVVECFCHWGRSHRSGALGALACGGASRPGARLSCARISTRRFSTHGLARFHVCCCCSRVFTVYDKVSDAIACHMHMLYDGPDALSVYPRSLRTPKGSHYTTRTTCIALTHNMRTRSLLIEPCNAHE